MANVSNGLTEKMKRFCREYYNNGGNGTEAYLVAYNTESRTTASRESSLLLKREDVNQYIKTLNIPAETKAFTEREKKRKVLWDIIERGDFADKCRAMDILNKMDQEYVNINRNITEEDTPVADLDTAALLRLVHSA